MNKKISFPIAIIIIVVCVVLAGLIVWQYKHIPNIDLFMESKYCKQDSDCVFTQCCGCASSCKRICSEQPEAYPCKCINNKCDKALDESADRKTYKNDEYGFEIKYPNDWKVEDEKSFYSMPFVIFRFKPGCMFTVELLPKEHADYNEVEQFKREGREWKSIIIADINGTIFEWEMITSPPIDVNSLQTSIYFNKEDNLYRIIRTVKKEGKWSECINVSDQILSTFKFLK